ncbi:uncharacterized protein [Lepeophtheirus salmonis]
MYSQVYIDIKKYIPTKDPWVNIFISIHFFIFQHSGLFLHIFYPSFLRPTHESNPSNQPSILISRIKREIISPEARSYNTRDLIELQKETNSLLLLIYKRLEHETTAESRAVLPAPPPLPSTTTTTTISPRILQMRETMRPNVIHMQINIPAQIFAGLFFRMINEYILSVRPPSTLNITTTTSNGTIFNETSLLNPISTSEQEKELVSPDANFNHCMDILFLVLALITIGILVLGVYLDIQRLFLPWLVFYGFEIFCGYFVFLSFLSMTGRFRVAGIIVFIRTLSLTYLWIMFVRRHLKEIIALGPRHMSLVDHIKFVVKKKLEPINECD